MPNQRDSNPDDKNVFTPGFLEELEEEDEPLTAGEAVGGPFGRVFQLDENSYGLFRSWESPKRGAPVGRADLAPGAPGRGVIVGRAWGAWARRFFNGELETT